MAQLKDLTGCKFGKLTVLEKAPSKNRKTQWKCICECGNTCIVSGEYLNRKAATIRSCGCALSKNIKAKEKEEKRNYLIGKKFGKLTVIERTNESSSSGIIWLCQCDCGNLKKVSTGLLTSGHTQSCGCLIRETHMIDITNQRFGKLTALYPCDYKKRQTILWHCRCDCGKECDVDGSFLRRGLTKSCGCITSSIGEINIEKILLNNDILYQKEYKYKDLLSKQNKPLRFDFALLNNNNQIFRLIEFDGVQHYSEISGIWNSEESLEERQQRDQKKNDYAIKNNIPLVRIPYWERDNITLEMIMGNQYLIN